MTPGKSVMHAAHYDLVFPLNRHYIAIVEATRRKSARCSQITRLGIRAQHTLAWRLQYPLRVIIERY